MTRAAKNLIEVQRVFTDRKCYFPDGSEKDDEQVYRD